LFGNFYRGKRVLVTGNTGFKGAWLSTWLIHLGAQVTGVSKQIQTGESLYAMAGLENLLDQYFFDIQDHQSLNQLYKRLQPDIVFHLAAQPLVTVSMTDPLGTIGSNVMGTSVVLDVLRESEFPVIAVIATTDKCYENLERLEAYREGDRLGGKDPYSASKAAAEILFSAYFRSFYQKEGKVKVIAARAGNVIGGGDFSSSRIVPDCIRSWSEGRAVTLRNGSAVRPWQHVLEPLSGYLSCAWMLSEQSSLSGEPFNFGPEENTIKTVRELVSSLHQVFAPDFNGVWLNPEEEANQFESNLLRLNIDKAERMLQWKPIMDFDTCVQFTGSWYRAFCHGKDMYQETLEQVQQYMDNAQNIGVKWAS
jgi:CDP-glucose 4,6-dehydratase